VFTDRKEAGHRLAQELLKYKGENPVVMALPRGGVPVGYEIALALEATLDIIVVRKLGAPGNPELGIGAIVDGDHPQSVLNEDVMRELNVCDDYLFREVAAQVKEIRRRQDAYRGGRLPADIAGRTVIVVDDGIATGGSIRAALRGLRRQNPKKLVLAVPVAPPEAIESLRPEADDVICLDTPPYFLAIGQFYENFEQTTDEEVIRLLDAAARGKGAVAQAESQRAR
jgi:putative phosphoribosyl transferase